jgi:hypothetical protein
MSWNWRDLVGLSFAAMLLGAAVWANFTGGAAPQDRGAWVSQAMR